MKGSQDIFIAKIDRFIRKYYQNQLIRGVLISTILLLSYFLFISFSEYYIYFSVLSRTIFALLFVVLSLLIIIKLIVIPAVGLLKIGKRLSHLQAVEIIGKYFPEFEDRLVNTLELTDLSNNCDLDQNTLLLASINQRIESIRLISFRKAISFKHNWKYLKYLGFICFLGIVIYLLIPDLYSKSTNRLLHYSRIYTPPADFYFNLDTSLLKVVKGSDFALKVTTKGKYNPEQAYIVYSNNKFLLKKDRSGSFSYNFRNVNAEVEFHFQSGKIVSRNYRIKLLSKPGLRSSRLSISPPKYTKLPQKEENNLADYSVPDGSLLHWKLEGEDADSARIVFSDKISTRLPKVRNSNFEFSRRIYQQFHYKILLSNSEFKEDLFASYSIDIIPDLYPTIEISSIQDSVITSGFYFKGIIKDDYGFTNLRFVYKIDKEAPIFVPVSFQKDIVSQAFYFAFDFALAAVKEGSSITYYFEVFDNDKIHQPKSTRSQIFDYYIPDSKQIYDLNEIVQDTISRQIDKSIELSKVIQKDILKMQENALNGHIEKWQQDQLYKNILSNKKELNDLLKELKTANQRKNQMLNSSGLQDSALVEKQKQIQKLLDKVMDSELQKLFDEFKKLSEELKTEDLNKIGNQLKMSFDDFQKQMDRNLKLLERYEIEVGVKQLVYRLEKLADKQDNSQEILNQNPEKIIEEYDNSKKKWEDFRKDLKDVLEKNAKIEKPYQFDDFNPDEESISDLLNKTKIYIENNKQGKFTKNRKETAKRQRLLAQKLSDNLAKSASLQVHVDVDNLIRLMTNLIEFSFQQEDVLIQFKRINYRNPLYMKLADQQGVLKEEYGLLQDSLQALAKHSPQVASLIGNRIFTINTLLELVMDKVDNKQIGSTNILQRNILTEVNELSLFLSEAIKQLMNQMANAMPGDQFGDKKGSKNAFPGLRAEQNSIKKMMQDLIQEMKDGKAKSGTNKKLGKLLQRQEMFQQKLEEMLKNDALGNESMKILREVVKMIDQTESDVSNFSINSTTILRQNNILSKLLKAENAEREKGFDKNRESKSGNNLKLSNPKEIFEYKRIRTDSGSLFYESNVKMLDYYNKLYLDYMIQINNDKIR